MRFNTRLLRTPAAADPLTGRSIPPIYLSSTFRQSAPNRNRDSFTAVRKPDPGGPRDGPRQARGRRRPASPFPPVWGRSPRYSSPFPVAAASSRSTDVYGGTWRLFEHHRRQFGLRVDYVNMADLDRLRSSLTEPADMVYLETPTNPQLGIVDIAGAVRLARRAHALVVVDNTFYATQLSSARSKWERTSSSTPPPSTRRPLRHHRRRSRGEGREAREGVHLAPERCRSGPEPVRLLPSSKGHPYPGGPHARPRGECPSRRGSAFRSPSSSQGALPGPFNPTPSTPSPVGR